MRSIILITLCLLSLSFGQNCGPQYGNQTCAPGDCCSDHGWCDTGPAWCDPTTCQKQFSGPGSSCASLATPAYFASSTSSSLPSALVAPPSYVSTVPNIDVCGHAVGGVSCPGAGVPPDPNEPGYYYRCCSSGGHCGPKNNIESQDLYCGADTCQVGFGDCATNRTAPPLPSGPPTTAGMGLTCGPIVNAKCGDGLCCSGSNYCGSTVDFCGAANWCQPLWGNCSD
ncbi:hypothetical protein HO173_008919 [Letharia columbiana]|uniref:Chitin-binding type-1 domain-containing protein n=1 Tax=Letharia columbiana TaxID=112416 RepID=A0A8H6FQR1_9LECA|nr:uncharacterized protein HO173_008919 [Letharia columbiana]KAF6232956.1 hypothetical protein HO173_008919 [Letharia columbiana]